MESEGSGKVRVGLRRVVRIAVSVDIAEIGRAARVRGLHPPVVAGAAQPYLNRKQPVNKPYCFSLLQSLCKRLFFLALRNKADSRTNLSPISSVLFTSIGSTSTMRCIS